MRLGAAWLMVNKVPFKRWRARLINGAAPQAVPGPAETLEARRLAVHVERAASRLPFKTLCLPRALALSAMMRARGLPHCLVIAVRPAELRTGEDDLHAWIDSGEMRVLGDLPGAWIPILTAYR